MSKALHHPYADLLEVVPALMSWVDTSGCYRYMSRACEDWCGVSRDECLGRHYSEILPRLFGPICARRAAPHMRQAIAGHPRSFESPIPTPGGPRFVRIACNPDRDRTGALRGVIVVITDLSDQRRAEQKASTSEERLSLAAEATSMGFWEHDLVNGVLTWNAACFRVFGLESRFDPPSFEEFNALVHPDDRLARASAFSRAKEHREPYESEYRILCPDGSSRWIHSRARIVFDKRARPLRAIGVAFDVTGRKIAEQQAAGHRERIHQILESTTDGFFTANRSWCFTWLNSRAAAMIGQGRNLLGMNLWEAFPLARFRKFGECYERTMFERIPTAFEEFYPEPLNRWFEVHAYPTDEGIAGFFRDTTQRRLREEALRLRDQAIAAVPVGISVARFDPAAGFPLVYVNPAFEQITGYSQAEILGRSCGFLQGAATEPAARATVHDALHAGQPATVLLRNHRKDGSSFINELQLSPVRNPEGEITHIVAIQNDVTERIAAAEHLCHQARIDDLTGIANRRMFIERLRLALRTTLRQRDRQLAVVFIDLDNLKHVNETCGHQGGDRVLRQIAQRIGSAVRETDLAARIGGDEFAVILADFPRRSSVERLVERILRRIAAPLRMHGRELVVTASAGFAVAPDDAPDAEDLLRKADLAMYAAKRERRSSWKSWNSSLESGRSQVIDIAAGLRAALRSEQFFLDWQPRLHARTGRIQSVEALIRWRHPDRGVVYPGDFIQIAEETGIICDVGRWVFRQAICQMCAWRDQGLRLVPVSVNVSAAQFRDPTLSQFVAQLLCEAGFPPHLLEVELTESIFIDETFSREFLESMRTLGVRIAIDDFGTGYSGLAYLSRFPVDILKIDRAFTQSIEGSSTASLICRSILQLARDLRLTTVAEGVESENQAILLREWGCDQLQGYHCGRPMSPAAIEALLSSAASLPTPRPRRLASPAVQ